MPATDIRISKERQLPRKCTGERAGLREKKLELDLFVLRRYIERIIRAAKDGPQKRGESQWMRSCRKFGRSDHEEW